MKLGKIKDTIAIAALLICPAVTPSEKKEEASITSVDYTADQRLLVANGGSIYHNGSQIHTFDQPITAFACSPTNQGEIALTCNEENEHLYRVKNGLSDSSLILTCYGHLQTIALRFNKSGSNLLMIKRPINKDTTCIPGYLVDHGGWALRFNPITTSARENDRVGCAPGKRGAYPVRSGRADYCIFSYGSKIFFQPEHNNDYNSRNKVEVNRGEQKDIATCDQWVVSLTKKDDKQSLHLHQLYTFIGPPELKYLSSLVIGDNIKYEEIEGTKADTLIATHKDEGADLYAIKKPWVGTKTLKKIKHLDTNCEPVTTVASTKASWFTCAKTALATKTRVYEVDSKNGEHIATYDSTGAVTNRNWRRTLRRATLTALAGTATVAATLLSYTWFKGKR